MPSCYGPSSHTGPRDETRACEHHVAQPRQLQRRLLGGPHWAQTPLPFAGWIPHVLSRFRTPRTRIPRHRRTPTLLLAAVLVGCGSAGGSGAQHSTRVTPIEVDSRPLPDGPSSALPPDYWELLDALPYRLTNEQNAQLYSQWQIRTQQCVAALGFKDYVLSEYPAQSRPELNPLDLPSAERFGYHITKPVLHSANDDLADRNPEYSRALFGAEGSPGCLQQTQDAVYGD